MATLSKHGTEIGRLYYTTTVKAYMSDGAILKKSFAGDWKLVGKCKPDITPTEAYRLAAERQRAFLAKRPALVAYRKALHEAVCMGKAWKLDLAIGLMPDDPDGVWSQACDGHGDNCHLDLDDVEELCHLYRAAIEEQCRANTATA